MTPPDASTVAAPDATASAGSADPFEAIFDGVLDANVPEQNFDLPKGRQLGESIPVESPKVEAPKTPAVEAPKATEPAAILTAPADETDDVGTPYAIGKDGRVRGADGRYAKKAVEPPPDPVAKPEATEKKNGAPLQSAPFRYRAMGETHEPKGITIDPEKGTLSVDAESVPLIREALNALKVRDVQHIPTIQRTLKENETLKAQLAERDSQSTAAEAQARALMASLEEALTTADDEQAVEKFFKMRADLPRLKTEAELAHWKNEASRTRTVAPATAPTPLPEKEASHGLPSQDEALGSARELLAHVKIDHQYRDLTDKDWQQFDAGVARKPLAYVRAATQEDVTKYGASIGQPVFDTDLMMDDVTQYATSLREQRAAALRQAQLAASNARTTQPTIAAPPAVTTSRPPAKQAASTGLKNKQELDDWLNSDEL